MIIMNDLTITKMLEDRQAAVFTTQQLAVLFGLKPNSTTVKLNRLVARGVLVRVVRGRYTLPSTNILAVASSIYPPSYVSLLAAFEYHGTTTQSPRMIDVINNVHTGRTTILLESGLFEIRFIKVAPYLLFGYEKNFINSMTSMIAEKEKTIVDSLLLIGYVSLDETVACIRSQVNYEKAMEYARRTGRQSVIKRLGYLLSSEGIDVLPKFLKGLSKTYVPLDPALSKRGKYDPKWRIIVNRVIE